jgi:hypothetical protein
MLERSGPRAICLDCRTLLDGEEPCDVAAHRVASLRTFAGRERLLVEVWGGSETRRAEMERARHDGRKHLWVGVGALGLPLLLHAHLWWAIGVVVSLSCLIDAALRQKVWRPGARLSPHGAAQRPAAIGGGSALRGVAVGVPELRAPASGRPCLAYALSLQRRRSVMLMAARTGPLTIQLEDGGTVEVPAGRLRMAGADEMVVGASGLLRRFLLAIDPLRAQAVDLDPFPIGQVREAILVEGDRVEIESPVAARLGAERPGRDPYRERPVQIWSAALPCVLRRL